LLHFTYIFLQILIFRKEKSSPFINTFGRLGRRVIEGGFSGGAIRSDAGVLLLRQVNQRIGLSR